MHFDDEHLLVEPGIYATPSVEGLTLVGREGGKPLSGLLEPLPVSAFLDPFEGVQEARAIGDIPPVPEQASHLFGVPGVAAGPGESIVEVAIPLREQRRSGQCPGLLGRQSLVGMRSARPREHDDDDRNDGESTKIDHD